MTKTPITRVKPTRPLTAAMIRATLTQFPEEVRKEKAKLYSFSLFLIIEYFLGKEWVERYILPETAKRRSFLFPDVEVTGRSTIWFVDILQLADCLYNLQGVPGFEAALAPMIGGDIESTMSVLIAGKLLKQAGKLFQFIEPMGVEGVDFDIALMYSPDQFAFLEVKCKSRSTERSYNTVIDALNRARGQLPPDHAGIVFMQVPDSWIEMVDGHRRVTGELFRAFIDFLRNSGRIVMLILYTTFIAPGKEATAVDHGWVEVINTSSRFAGNKWSLFEEFTDDDIQNNWDAVDKYIPEAMIT